MRRAADNPFAAHRIDALRFRPRDTSWDEILERLARLSWRAAIVGPEGAGKTTLLEELAGRLPQPTRVVHLGGGIRALPVALTAAATATRDEILLVDAAEVLGPLAWRRFASRARHAAGLVITLHRPGRLPTLLRCRTSPALLAELVAELAPELATQLGPELETLFVRHRGDLRRCLLALYDRAGAG